MPQLVEYSNKENLQPTDRGTEARVQEGRRIQAGYNQVAESLRDTGHRLGQQLGGAVRDAGDAMVAYQDHQQISRGSTAGMEMLASLTTRWNATAKSADPNDPSVGPNFLEKTVQPELDNFREGFTTEKSQQWAEHFIEGVRNHLYEKTTADMSSMAGAAIVGGLHKVTNTGANTAMQDPSSVDFLLKNTDHIVEGIIASSPSLKPTDAARIRAELTQKIKETYVKAGAIGAIQKSTDPEKTAEEWPQKHPEYITGDEAKILAANARSQIRARNADEQLKDRREKEARTEASDEAENQYIIDMSASNPKLRDDPTMTKALNDPDLTRAARARLLNLHDRQMKPETDARISAQTFTGLLHDLRDPNADAKVITDKAWDARLLDAGKPGSLSQSDFDRIRKEIVDRKTPDGQALAHDRDEFFKKFERTIDVGRKDELSPTALGMQKIYEATSAAKQQEAVLKAKGQDPHSLYDPASPNYFGKQITRFRPTLAEQTAFDAQLKADKASKEPSATAASFNDRFKGGAPVEAPKSAPEEPPRPGARKAADGNWYVEKDGKFFRVDKK